MLGVRISAGRVSGDERRASRATRNDEAFSESEDVEKARDGQGGTAGPAGIFLGRSAPLWIARIQGAGAKAGLSTTCSSKSANR